MIKDNLIKVQARIAGICAKIGRNPEEVVIVAVSKGRDYNCIQEAIEAGLTDIGENKIHEALNKYNQLLGSRFSVIGAWTSLSANGERSPTIGYRRTPNTQHPTPIKWHMVGHLQSNKVKQALNIFDLVHSVDSLSLAFEIDKQAIKLNKIQDCLIEVNTSGELSKFGFKPDETVKVIKEIAQLKNINIKGLMTVAPIADNPDKTRPFFRKLRELLDRINELRITGYELRILSMGMTDDFEAAIEEGSNMIRLGRAIFEGQGGV